MKKITLSGSVLVFLGAFFWSLNAPLVKFINMDSLLLCGMRSLIAGFTLLPFLRLKKLHWSPWMIVYLLCYCGLSVGIIFALSKTSAAIAIGMQYTSMIWLFLANLLLTRKLQKKLLIPVCMISFGVFLFMCSGFQGGSLAGNLIALTEGICFAGMSVGAKMSSGKNPLGLTALANLFTGFFVFLFLPPTFSDIGGVNGQEWIVLLILGVVQMGAGYSFYNLGVRKVTAQKASIIALWEMILGPVWVAIFLREYPSLLVVIGFVVIILGMVVNTRIDKEESTA